MDKLQTLIHLIQSLDARESRYIKQNSLKSEGNYLKLVELLEKKGNEATTQDIEKTGVNASTTTYERLIEKIVFAINTIDESPKIQHLQQLQLIMQLINKGCLDHALDLYKKLERQVEDVGNFSLSLLLLLQKEHFYILLADGKSIVSFAKELREETEKVVSQLVNLYSYFDINYKLIELSGGTYNVRAQNKEMEKLRDESMAMLENLPNPKSIAGKIMYHSVRGPLLSHTNPDESQQIEEHEALVNTYIQSPNYKKNHIFSFCAHLRKAMEIIATKDNRLSRKEKLYELITIARSPDTLQLINDKEFKKNFLLSTINAELLFIIRTLTFNPLVDLELYYKNLMSSKNKVGQFPREEILILYLFAHAHFLKNDLNKANKYLIQLTIKEEKGFTEPQFLYGKILSIVISFEKNDFELVVSIARSLLRGSKNETFPLYPVFVPMLRFLQEHSYAPDIKQTDWEKPLNETKKIKEKLQKSGVRFVGFDIILWMQSKLEGKPLLDILKTN